MTIYLGKTLPGLHTAHDSSEPTPVLRMTVVFHPDVTRIGESVDLCPWDWQQPAAFPDSIVVGRLSPLLSDGKPLADPHISRRAFVARPRVINQPGAQPGLRVEADEYADVRVGADRHTQFIADDKTLQRGVPVCLGHAVVVVLRCVTPQASSGDPQPEELVRLLPGVSPAMQGLRERVAAVAPTMLPVLLLGESGVGKERVASALHALSHRSHNDMEVINLAAVPESLAAAELFGSVRGGFTGATARDGAFRRAHGGTLFLDEVADAPLNVQVQLLRALEQGEIQVVGGAVQRVDVRIIAATDQDLTAASGFREALRNRLAGFTLAIPPLRERPEDIGPQAMSLLEEAVTLPESLNPARSVEEPSLAAAWARFFYAGLQNEWLGNSRELRHALAAMAMGEPRFQNPPAPGDQPAAAVTDRSLSDGDLMRIYESQHFEISATAALLGLSRQALYRRLEGLPEFTLVDDLTDYQIEQAVDAAGSPEGAALSLRVSLHALRPRLRRLSAR